MNILRDAIVKYQITFYLRCWAVVFWVTGIAMIFNFSWQIGAGLMMMLLADSLVAKASENSIV